MSSGKELVAALLDGRVMERPPFIPILGGFAQRMGQMSETDFRENPQLHARALLQTADALNADALTVGVGCSIEVGIEACKRLAPVLQGRGLVACLSRPEPTSARAYCEEGADMVLVLEVDPAESGRFRTLSNVCKYYRVPVLLAAAGLEAPSALAQQLKLDGAIVPWPTGDEPGIIGGGLGACPNDVAERGPGSPPRESRFFWSFPGEIAPGSSPETLVRLGDMLTGQSGGVPG